MDIDLYRQLINRYWVLLLSVIVIVTVGSGLFASTRSESYQGSVYLSVAQAPQANSAQAPFYQYGEFYAIQGSNFLADYFRGWLRDPATIAEILEGAGGGLPNKSLTSISRFFNVKPLGTVGLQIFHTTSSSDETTKTLESLKLVLTNRLTSLQEQGFYEDFAVVPSDVLVKATRPDVMMVSLIGFGSGLVLAVLMLLILASITPSRKA